MTEGIEVVIRSSRGVVLALLLLGMQAYAAPPSVDVAAQPRMAEKTVPAPIRTSTENRTNPIGVDRLAPRLSWRSPVISQSAYEIQVASSRAALRSDRPDLWSSGRIEDGRSLAIEYEGAPLASRQRAFWRVRIWADGASAPSSWSEIASWQMALLKQEDWRATWITAPDFDPAKSTPGLERWLNATAADPQFKNAETVSDTKQKLRDVRPATYFRKAFTIDRPVKSALLYSTSAGYSEFYLSGQKIGDRMFNPAQTDFDKRIYYDVDDISPKLGIGTHALAVHLGNGFYGERTAFGLDTLFYGEPAVIAQLEIEYQDGSSEIITSDASWQAHPSPILKNGVYSGEVYDARAQVAYWSAADGGQSAGWQDARPLAKAPTQQLVAAEMPPVRRVTEVQPKAIQNPKTGVWTIDFGQNFTGVPTIDVAQLSLQDGQTVVFRYAEWADEAGNVSLKSGGAAPRTKQVDAYVSDGADKTPWSPTFTWHGFRYMEISGLDKAPPLTAFTGYLTRTDVEKTGHFVSSSPLLNRIHETALWSFEANLISVPSDCPIRERNGWTGDAHATVRMASYNYSMGPFLEKYLGDFRTTEMIAPTIVPGRRTRSGMVDWAAAEVFLTWEHYLHTGDLSVIERQYDSLLEYVSYVEGVADDNLITNTNHFYGDWCDTLPEPGMARPLGRCMSFSTPGDVTASALIIRVFDQMSGMAARLGRHEDKRHFALRRDAIRSAFNNAYYQDDTLGYGSQTANAMALQFGIAPAEKEPAIAAAIDRDIREEWGGRASVGALGQSWLYPALSDHGHTDTAFGIFTAEGPGSYKYLFDTLGGTTIWEDATKFIPGNGDAPGKSLNHPFHGGYDAWFYSGLGGINPDPEQPGYKHFFLRPVFPKALNEASVSLATGYGTISSEWRRDGDGIIWNVEIPHNTSATVNLTGMPAIGRKTGPGQYSFRLNASGGLIDFAKGAM